MRNEAVAAIARAEWPIDGRFSGSHFHSFTATICGEQAHLGKSKNIAAVRRLTQPSYTGDEMALADLMSDSRFH
jgi:hypothetical protein